MEPTTSTTAVTMNAKLWTGRILTAIAVLFLLFDAFGKFFKPEPVIQGTTALGYPESLITPIGIILLVCTIVYIVPRTSILGAILLTGYLGGAVASNLRIGAPLFSNTLFPVYLAIILWLGLYFRNERLRKLVSIKNQ